MTNQHIAPITLAAVPGQHPMHPSLSLLLALLLYAASVATVGLFFKSQLDECRFTDCVLCASWSIQCATRLQPCSWGRWSR